MMNDFRLSEPDPLSDRTPRILSYFPDAGNGTRGKTEKMVKKEKSLTVRLFRPLVLLGETHFSGAIVRARTRVREACRAFQVQKTTPARALQGGEVESETHRGEFRCFKVRFKDAALAGPTSCFPRNLSFQD